MAEQLGVVAAPHRLATEIGTEILQNGGNAFDAAVAVSLAIGVAQPYHSGIGGGCNSTYRLADGTMGHINARGPAPAALTREHFLRADGTPDHELATIGGLAVTIPSLTAGLYRLHHGRGRLPWRDLCLAPQHIAAEGFAADSMMGRYYARKQTQEKLARHSLDTPLGRPIQEGERVVQPQMAETLAAIAADPRAIYSGDIGRSFVATVQRTGGVLTMADLEAYQPQDAPLHTISYRDWQIFAPGLPTIGSLQTLLALQILQHHDLGTVEPGSPAHYHLLSEAIRGTYALRAQMESDAEAASLIEPRYATQLANAIRPDRVEPHHFAEIATDRGTSHFCVADAEGNVVSQTQTVRSHFGCGVVDPETGIVLNDSVGDFSLQPGQVTTQGIRYQGNYNLVRAGAEPASSQSPLIARHDPSGDMLAAGAAGGPMIVSATIQGVTNQLDFGMTPAVATAFPRVHTHGPVTYVEPTTGVSDALTALGHTVEEMDAIAVMQTIRRQDSTWSGGADPRCPGSAETVTM